MSERPSTRPRGPARLGQLFGGVLGGALAAVLASIRRPAEVVTFGAPRVGDADFIESLEGLPVQRFENACDLVPGLPPEVMGFRHLGVRRYLNASGMLSVAPSDGFLRRSRRRARLRFSAKGPWLRRGWVKMRSLGDHAIQNYTAALYRAEADARS